VACRSVLLAARCFTRTVSSGLHRLTPYSHVNPKPALVVASRSTSARNSLRASSLSAINAGRVMKKYRNGLSPSFGSIELPEKLKTAYEVSPHIKIALTVGFQQ
jgi:hypothetical protein